MPELPEVEAARALVEAHCCGRKIVDVIANESGGGPRDGLFDDLVCAGVSSAAELRAALVGRTLTASKRLGKQMYWELSGSGPSLLTHFGMSGAFSIFTEAAGGATAALYKRVKVDTSAWPPKFCKLELAFEGGVRLAFTDPRRLGRVKLLAGDPLTQPPLSELGPDALTAFPDVPSLAAALASRSVPVKALLLDQSWLAGIGNYLADEILYTARIHPESMTNALTPADVAALHAAATDVIGLAVSVNADSDKFPKHWLFHIRWGKGKGAVPKTVDGHSVTFITVGGRTSAVVAAVQGAPKKRPVAVPAAATAGAVSAASAAVGSGDAVGLASTSGKRRPGKASAAAVVAEGAAAEGSRASASCSASGGAAVPSPSTAPAASGGAGVSGNKRKRGVAAPADAGMVSAVAGDAGAVTTLANGPAAKRRRGAAAIGATAAAAAGAPAVNGAQRRR